MQTAPSQTSQRVPFTDNPTEWEMCLRRVRAEFWEMPGLALSVAQAKRLWSLESVVVEKLFAELVASGDLRQRHDQRYVRARNDR